jgi:DNA polymerase-3 subunit gamma/tau
LLSLALARKYRPATFDDLIGQESVSQTLSLALDGNRLSHAYLFSGLRGSGKTSTARIFAKALLCEKGSTSHPCGTCPHCVMSAENRHMDIIEMDAASNRGIDDIKDLIEHTKYKPSSARYKIFIIDEVHI